MSPINLVLEPIPLGILSFQLFTFSLYNGIIHHSNYPVIRNCKKPLRWKAQEIALIIWDALFINLLEPLSCKQLQNWQINSHGLSVKILDIDLWGLISYQDCLPNSLTFSHLFKEFIMQLSKYRFPSIP